MRAFSNMLALSETPLHDHTRGDVGSKPTRPPGLVPVNYDASGQLGKYLIATRTPDNKEVYRFAAER